MLIAVSGTLGMSMSALPQAAVRVSLRSIAQPKGVSQQSLIQSTSTALTQNGSTASGSQLQQIATSIANRTSGADGHHHHHGGGGSRCRRRPARNRSTVAGVSCATSTPSAVIHPLICLNRRTCPCAEPRECPCSAR
jgi:hypothetical protein